MSDIPSPRTRLTPPPVQAQQSKYGSFEVPKDIPKTYAIDLYEDGYDDPVYQAKARILNHAIQEIGMGRYQVWRKKGVNS